MDIKINQHFLPLLSDNNRFLVLKGAAGSGKSYFIAQLLLLRLTTEEATRILIVRKTGNTLKESCFKLMEGLIYQYNLQKDFSINQTDYTITCLETRSQLVMKGLDDEQKLKSIFDINSCWIEEADQIELDDFLEINRRIRGVSKYKQQIYLTFNPTSENSWLKAYFFDDKPDNATLHQSTYLQNPLVSEEYKAEMLKLKKTDPNQYRIYALGEWGITNKGQILFKQFDPELNVKKLNYNPDLPLILSFDFNVNPYCSLTIAQIHRTDFKKIIKFIGELYTVYPKNTTKALCELFKTKYFDLHQYKDVFVTGDPANKKLDTRSEEGFNDYNIIYSALSPYFRVEDRLLVKAPAVKTRSEYINNIFSLENEEVEIEIDESCIKLIEDLTYLKEDSDGGKLIEYVTDKVTKKRYEKYGHCFVAGTKVSTDKGDVSIENIKKDDLVLTRKGYKKVLWAGLTKKDALVKNYNLGFDKITCTPEHKFLTNEGWKEIDLIQKNEIIFIKNQTFSASDTISYKEFIVWKKILLLWMVLNLLGILIVKNVLKGFIILGGLIKRKLDCIDTYTKNISEKLKKDFTFITKMKIHLTTIFQTWSVLREKSIFQSIIKIGQQKKKSFLKIFYLQKHKKQQKNGINLKKAEHGIENMLKKQYYAVKKESVLDVAKNILQKLNYKSIVLKNALINTKQENTDLKHAELFLVKEKKVIDEHRADVYCLEVEDEHEFFANGFLVHNCSDSLSYLVCRFTETEYSKFKSGNKPAFFHVVQDYNQQNIKKKWSY